MRTCLFVGIGGFLGTVCRYLVSLIPISEKNGFPFNTLIINVLGALIVGFLSGLSAKYNGINADIMAFLRKGICGGFTTFSTFALETTSMLGEGKGLLGILYVALSLILGIGAVLIGKSLSA